MSEEIICAITPPHSPVRHSEIHFEEGRSLNRVTINNDRSRAKLWSVLKEKKSI